MRGVQISIEAINQLFADSWHVCELEDLDRKLEWLDELLGPLTAVAGFSEVDWWPIIGRLGSSEVASKKGWPEAFEWKHEIATWTPKHRAALRSLLARHRAALRELAKQPEHEQPLVLVPRQVARVPRILFVEGSFHIARVQRVDVRATHQ